MLFFRQILEKTAIFVKKMHLKQQCGLLYLYLQDGIFFEKQYRGVALLRQRHAVKPVHLRWGVKGAYGRYRLGMAGAISAQHLFRSV